MTAPTPAVVPVFVDEAAITYVPWDRNKWGLIMRLVTHPERPFGLRAFAYGVRHPAGMTVSVYVIADRRLNCPT